MSGELWKGSLFEAKVSFTLTSLRVGETYMLNPLHYDVRGRTYEPRLILNGGRVMGISIAGVVYNEDEQLVLQITLVTKRHKIP